MDASAANCEECFNCSRNLCSTTRAEVCASIKGTHQDRCLRRSAYLSRRSGIFLFLLHGAFAQLDFAHWSLGVQSDSDWFSYVVSCRCGGWADQSVAFMQRSLLWRKHSKHTPHVHTHRHAHGSTLTCRRTTRARTPHHKPAHMHAHTPHTHNTRTLGPVT